MFPVTVALGGEERRRSHRWTAGRRWRRWRRRTLSHQRSGLPLDLCSTCCIVTCSMPSVVQIILPNCDWLAHCTPQPRFREVFSIFNSVLSQHILLFYIISISMIETVRLLFLLWRQTCIVEGSNNCSLSRPCKDRFLGQKKLYFIVDAVLSVLFGFFFFDLSFILEFFKLPHTRSWDTPVKFLVLFSFFSPHLCTNFANERNSDSDFTFSLIFVAILAFARPAPTLQSMGMSHWTPPSRHIFNPINEMHFNFSLWDRGPKERKAIKERARKDGCKWQVLCAALIIVIVIVVVVYKCVILREE